MIPGGVIHGTMVPLLRSNIDTDQIIPVSRMNTVSRTGLGAGLFAGWRYDGAGREDPAFILNQPAYRNATILVAGANFGCGSSREHAVWALVDYGVRCVIAPSFGSIFAENSGKNAFPLVTLDEASCRLLAARAADPATADVAVDIGLARIVACDGSVYPFVMAAEQRRDLIEGIDEIARTLEHVGEIDAFQALDRAARPWAWPG